MGRKIGYSGEAVKPPDQHWPDCRVTEPLYGHSKQGSEDRGKWLVAGTKQH